MWERPLNSILSGQQFLLYSHLALARFYSHTPLCYGWPQAQAKEAQASTKHEASSWQRSQEQIWLVLM